MNIELGWPWAIQATSPFYRDQLCGISPPVVNTLPCACAGLERHQPRID
ncbi:MAG: hypothetical protein ABSG20_28245 [Bradyrhizobium sp.]